MFMNLLYFSDKFIPFKTPLDHKYDDQVPDESKFNIQMFLSSVKATYQVSPTIDIQPFSQFVTHFESWKASIYI